MNGEIVVHSEAAMSMVMSPAEAAKQQAELAAFVHKAMVGTRDGTGDYGLIPGAGDRKTLFKAGAEKLCAIFNLAASYHDDGSISDFDRPTFANAFFNFRKVCKLTNRATGAFVGEGIGSCNSREKKYAGRWVPEAEVPDYLPRERLLSREALTWVFDNKIPAGVDMKTLPMKSGFSQKTNKEWKQFGIKAMTFFVPNEDIFSLANTIEKMAAKRAFVSAVMAATRVSGLFDGKFDDDDFGQEEDVRSWEQREKDATAAGEAPKPTGPATAPATPTRAKAPALASILARIDKMAAKASDVGEVDLFAADTKSEREALSDADYETVNNALSDAFATIKVRMEAL